MAREIIVLDGVKIELEDPDLDHDGKIGGVEILKNPNFSGESEIITPNNDSELIKELNKDELEGEMGMSSIDMKANLHNVEVTALLAFDAIVGLRFLPKNCLPFTRQKKRLSRSVNFKGSQQIVEMITGKKEQDAKMGFNIFGNKNKDSQVVQK